MTHSIQVPKSWVGAKLWTKLRPHAPRHSQVLGKRGAQPEKQPGTRGQRWRDRAQGLEAVGSRGLGSALGWLREASAGKGRGTKAGLAGDGLSYQPGREWGREAWSPHMKEKSPHWKRTE